MATVAELQAKLSSLERLIDANLAKRDALSRELDSIQEQRRKLYAGGDKAGAAVLRSQETAIDDQIVELQRQYQDEAAALRRQIEGAESAAAPPPPEPQPPVTASQSAQDDAAKGPNAPEPAQVNSDGRIVAPPDTSKPSNAETPVTSNTGGDTGTNDPVRTTEQTQSTNTNSTGPSATIEGGTATKDDAANNSTSTKQTEVNATEASLVKIIPQPNVLDDYFSYSSAHL